MNFKTRENIIKASKMIKIKNSEGNDRIPQRLYVHDMTTHYAMWLTNTKLYINFSMQNGLRLRKINVQFSVS